MERAIVGLPAVIAQARPVAADASARAFVWTQADRTVIAGEKAVTRTYMLLGITVTVSRAVGFASQDRAVVADISWLTFTQATFAGAMAAASIRALLYRAAIPLPATVAAACTVEARAMHTLFAHLQVA